MDHLNDDTSRTSATSATMTMRMRTLYAGNFVVVHSGARVVSGASAIVPALSRYAIYYLVSDCLEKTLRIA